MLTGFAALAHRWRLLPSLALFVTPAVISAQSVNVGGRVTAEGSTAPLSEARVFLVGTSVSAQTNSEGRYTLRGVPQGTVEVRVIRVGYQQQKKSVVVGTAGAELDFTLAQVIAKLDEIVTTATGEQRRVELGHSVATIGDVSQRLEQSSVTNFGDLLVAKAPGVVVLPGNMTGSAPNIRIRGLNSLSLSNAPIWVVDGIRVNSNAVNIGTGGTTASLLSTMSPEEIADIEIVKGPSAATLYGTDAANGVIVITTKKGHAGAARWAWHAENSLIQDRNAYPTQYAIWGHAPATPNTPRRCVLVTIASGACVSDSTTSYNLLETPGITPVHDGDGRQYGLQVSGGTDAVRYFLSGDLQREHGPLKMPEFAMHYFDSLKTSVRDEWEYPESLKRNGFRANLNAAISPKIDVGVTANIGSADQRLPQVDNNSWSYLYNSYLNPGFRGAGLGYANVGGLGETLNGYRFFSPAQTFQAVSRLRSQRTVASANTQWRPLTWLQNEATLGVDQVDRNTLQLCRFAECPADGTAREGFVSSRQVLERNYSAKLLSTLTWQARSSLNLKTSLGADYINSQVEFSLAEGVQLPPGAQSPGQSAVQDADGTTPQANKTLGVYAQEQASIRDRLFLTAAVRSDQNSAFGTKFQRVFYPKVSASWIVSDEPFFAHPSWLSQLRLRTAYGASGVQPGPTDAMIQYASQTSNIASLPGTVSASDTPGLLATALGNPELRPERSAEFEGGFEARLFNSRLNLDVTYFNKKTKDALIAFPLPPSAGPSSLTVRRNLGSIENNGVEASMTTTIVSSDRFGWDLTVGGSHITNRIASLGVDPQGKPNPTIGTGSTRDSLGLPVNAWLVRPFTYDDKNKDGYIDASEVTVGAGLQYSGYSTPRDVVSIQSGVDLLRHKVRLSMLLDYKGGFSVFNQTGRFLCQQSDQCYDETHKETGLYNQARLVAMRYKNPATVLGYLENGQFWRVRELSANVQAPSRVATLVRARDASLTFAARNLHIWTKYTGTDPESNFAVGDVQTDLLTTAPPTFFTLRLNLHY